MPISKLYLSTVATKRINREPSAILLSPDRKCLASCRSAEITIWEVAKPESALAVFRAPCGIIQDLAFSPDGKRLAAATDESQTVVWSYPDGQRIAVLEGRLHKQGFFKNLLDTSAQNKAVFSPNGKYLASLDNLSRPLIWNMENYSLHKHLEEPAADSPHNIMDFSPDGHMLAVAHAHKVALYHVETGIKIKDFRAASQSLAFHKHKKQLAVAAGKKIILFDPNQSGMQLETTKDDKKISIGKITFNRDGKYLLAAGRATFSHTSSDILCAWFLPHGIFMEGIYPDLLSLDSGKGPGRPLCKIYFTAPDYIAAVNKRTAQIILFRLEQPPDPLV